MVLPIAVLAVLALASLAVTTSGALASTGAVGSHGGGVGSAPGEAAAGALGQNSGSPAASDSAPDAVLGPSEAVPGEVESTLVLTNGTSAPGNFLSGIGLTPRALLYDPATGDLEVAAESSGNLIVVNPTSDRVVGAIPAGDEPVSIAYDPSNGRLYVADQSNTVSVIDPSTGTLVATLPSGYYLTSIAYDPVSGLVYVGILTRNDVGRLLLLDPENDSWVGSITVGGTPVSIAYDPANENLYVADFLDDNVTVVNSMSDRIAGSIPVGSEPESLAVDPANDEIFVANAGSSNVSVIDGQFDVVVGTLSVVGAPESVAVDAPQGQLDVVATVGLTGNLSTFDISNDTLATAVPTPLDPSTLGVVPTTGDVYVASYYSNSLSVFDPTTAHFVGDVILGSEPDAIAYDSLNGDLLVTDRATRSLDVVDPSNDSVVARISAGSEPIMAAFDPNNGCVYVVDAGGSVSVLNATNDEFLGSITVGAEPLTDVYDSGNGEVYVVNAGSDNVSVIDPSEAAVVASVAVQGFPTSIAYDPANGDLYVAYVGSENVTVIDGTNNSVVAEVDVGVIDPTAVAVDAASGLLFLLSERYSAVFEVSTASERLIREVGLPLLGAPQFYGFGDPIAFDDRNGYLYLALGYNLTEVLDGANGSLLGYFGVGEDPDSVAYDPQLSELFVANLVDGSLSVVRPLYLVSFHETGLPSGALSRHGWSIELGGVRAHEYGAWATYAVGNGSYPYSLSGPKGFRVTGGPPAGSIAVQDASTTISVELERGATYALTIAVTGLAHDRSWCVNLSGEAVCADRSTTKVLNLTGGAYSYAVASPLVGQSISARFGGHAVNASGTLDLTHAERLTFSFSYPYYVTFWEVGRAGEPWSVTVHGETLTNSTGGPIVAHLGNGTYRYSVVREVGYRATGVPSRAVVSGAPASVTVTFVPRAGEGPHASAGAGAGSDSVPRLDAAPGSAELRLGTPVVVARRPA